MLADFWHLNGNNNQTVTQAQLVNLIAANQLIENVIYQPGLFAPVRPQSIVGGRVFRNVSFRSAHFQGIEFRSSSFEDCLFMGAIFEHCEFHECTFVGCNPYKARFINTYIDPKVFDRTLDPEHHANIGVFLFQQLRFNAFATYQPDFAESADWLFRKWQRYELNYKFLNRRITGPTYWSKWTLSHIYELVAGFGHSFTRFAITSSILFAIIVILNHTLWQNFSTGGSALKASHHWYSASYFTAVTLTTLGYGDITPKTVSGMMLAGAEALTGFFWFALLAAMLVRRFFR
jgi:hypothetical protein